MSRLGAVPSLSVLPSRSFAFFLLQSLLFVLLLNLLAANAQDLAGLEQGIKPYGSYEGGDIDSISMVNGGLTLRIPLISFPQRGGRLHFGVSVIYNNPIYTLLDNRVNGRCPTECYTWEMGSASSSNPNTGAGLSVVFDLPGMTDVVTFPGGQGSCPLIMNYKVVEQDGAAHLMSTTNNGNWLSLDTTGYAYNGLGVLADRQGTQYTYNLVQYVAQGQNCGSYLPTTLNRVQDVNGNYITANSSGGYTDTMGRAIPASGLSTTDYSYCSGSLATSSAVVWNFPGPNGGTAQFKVCYAQFPINYTPTCAGYVQCYGVGGPRGQIQSIVLPNLTTWTFAFDETGALSNITFPTGGTISYTPTPSPNYHCFPGATTTVALQANASVLTRTVNANDGSGAHQWLYDLSPMSGSNGGSQAIVTDPNGNDAVHTLTALPTNQPNSCSLYETELDQYSGSHNNPAGLLRTTVTNYSAAWGGSNVLYGEAAINVVPTSVTTTDVPAVRSTQVTKTWDSGVASSQEGTVLYGDLMSESDYDFTGSSPLRTTNYSYMALSGPNASKYLGWNLLSLPYTVQVESGSGAQTAYTYYGYDESSLQSSGVTEQKTTGVSYPGNQTSVHRWLNGSAVSQTPCSVSVSNGYLVSSNIFYDTGEVQQSTDPCGYPITYQYSSTYFGAYLTTVTNALGQSTTYTYDPNSGSVTSIQDPNANALPTTKSYDIMDRLLSVNYPDGGSTSYCYTDGVPSNCSSGNAGSASFAVVETKLITSSTNEISTATVDGLGRLSQAQLNSDPSGTTYTLTTYDALGRKSQVYNPTRCSSITSNCSNETTWGYTTTNYDALGRVQSVTEQDGSTVQTTYDQINASNSGVCTTVTDEAGKSRQSCVDGLGRMTGVWEDTGSSPHLNYETDYSYDALNNLQSVTQKGTSTANARVRTFTYDSLSRLACAANPEVQAVTCPPLVTSPFPPGAITYGYDADGNVITKTAPLPNQTAATSTATTTYTYDQLNRLTGKSYMDGSTHDPYTPPVQFGYDGVALTGCSKTPPSITDTYPIGRRTSMCDGSSTLAGSGSTSWTHDPMGRVLTDHRFIGSVSAKIVTYVYNLDGSTYKVTAPDGKTVVYAPGGDGRPLSGLDGSGDNYVKSATYAPPGELQSLTDGGVIYRAFSYNSRLQPLQMFYGTNTPPSLSGSTCPSTVGNIMHRVYAFNSGSGDNGNVISIANCRDTTRTQNFLYDPLNRIWQAYSTGPNWGETYSTVQYAAGTPFSAANAGIDAWGNLTNETGIPGKTNHEGLNTSALTNNQLSSYGYDAAGNMTGNNPTAYYYDAENRLVWTSGIMGDNDERYIYDADGNRVEKCVAGSATTACPTSGTNGTLYWTGTGSAALDESDLSGNMLEQYVFFGGLRVARRDVSTGAIHFYFSDHLGSESVVENATGTSCEQDIDYYPYGGQENDYCPNVAQHYKFTGKERDTESGLDNFGARYDSSSMGRFMSPDPLGGSLVDPQTLNKYSYVRNNPINLTDPTGLYTCADSTEGHNCTSDQDKAFEKARQADLKSKDADVVRGASAYGDPTKDNGVSVKFGDPGKGNDGITSHGLGVGPDGKLRAEENVTIKEGLSGSGLDAVVGHEGSHVADAQDFVSTMTMGGNFDVSKNLSKYQTEFKAYMVSNSIMNSQGDKASYGQGCDGGPCVLGFGVGQRQAGNTINQLLANPANGYGVTPKAPGALLYPTLTVPTVPK